MLLLLISKLKQPSIVRNHSVSQTSLSIFVYGETNVHTCFKKEREREWMRAKEFL